MNGAASDDKATKECVKEGVESNGHGHEFNTCLWHSVHMWNKGWIWISLFKSLCYFVFIMLTYFILYIYISEIPCSFFKGCTFWRYTDSNVYIIICLFDPFSKMTTTHYVTVISMFHCLSIVKCWHSIWCIYLCQRGAFATKTNQMSVSINCFAAVNYGFSSVKELQQ